MRFLATPIAGADFQGFTRHSHNGAKKFQKNLCLPVKIDVFASIKG
jgi:hypothetical protein